MRTKNRTIIAIDPDVDKSGVAILTLPQRKLELDTLTFPELLDVIKRRSDTTANLTVVVEAGWLNKSNWHTKQWDNKQVSAAKGVSVGRNHEVGRKIVEMCKHWNISVIEQKPLPKTWKGKDNKISHQELAEFAPIPKRTNQENRDATLIAWVYANLPIRMQSMVL